MLADGGEKAPGQCRLEDRRSMPAPASRLGVPTKLVPQQSSDANGAKWTFATGTIQIQLARRKEANPTTAKLAEQEKKEPAGRKIDYSVVKPDFFVLSGMQGLKKFYLRGQIKGDEVRILTILYDQATEGTMEPVVIAMSSAFNPFPTGAQADGAAAAQDRRIRHRHRRQRRRRDRHRPAGRRRLPVDRGRRAMAMPIAPPRTRTTTSRCCASTARAD